ncbi:MAG: RIP metalloprotease RseP [Firmicutes bacterium]|nr:RIP metalloprotease RseP [Bacillota bacterium]
MIGTIIASVIIFGLLIFVHELGHFLVAKWAKIRVLEFALGFGKELLTWEKGETRYSLRLFPLGGFCRMLGEDPEDLPQEGNFQEKPLLNRFAVIAAGSVMNFLLAVVLFSLLFFLIVGVPGTDSTRVGAVLPQSRAFEAGIRENDLILAIDGVKMNNWNSVVSKINSSPGKELTIHIERNQQDIFISVVPEEKDGRGLIGITPVYEKYNFFSSIVLGVDYFFFWIKLIFVGLYQMITGIIPPDVTGPVGIVGVIGEVMQEGISNLFSLTAVISINLGIINLLPIPALDGSRLVFLLLEGIRGKPIDPKKEGFIHFIGFTFLILLMIFIAFQDITRLIY